MKVVILAGGRGTRLKEQTSEKPKPMVQVGGKPLIWHILKHYRHYGFEDFIIATGYRGEIIREYFSKADSGFRVDVVDTGLQTSTGGRLKRLAPLLGDETFMMTWSDAVSNVDLSDLATFHRRHGRTATVTAVHPPPRFGRLFLDGPEITDFVEKRPDPSEWINGAYFVLEPAVMDYISGDETHWEDGPMQRLVSSREMLAFRHDGFWQCVDTLHELELVNDWWASGAAPWRIWE